MNTVYAKDTGSTGFRNLFNRLQSNHVYLDRRRTGDPEARSTAGLVVLGAATFIGVSTEVLPVGLLHEISTDLSISEAAAGLTVTGYALVVALSATPLTVATAHWPRRRLLLTVLAAYAAVNVLAGLAPNFAVLLIARALGGLCHGVFWSMNTGYAARLVREDQVGRATGAVFTGSALAVAVGLPLATATGQAFGWRITTLGAAALTVVIALAARLFLPALDALPTPRTEQRVTGPVRAALNRPGVRAVAVITGLIVLGLYVFFSYISVYLSDLGLTGPTIAEPCWLTVWAGLSARWYWAAPTTGGPAPVSWRSSPSCSRPWASWRRFPCSRRGSG